MNLNLTLQRHVWLGLPINLLLSTHQNDDYSLNPLHRGSMEKSKSKPKGSHQSAICHRTMLKTIKFCYTWLFLAGYFTHGAGFNVANLPFRGNHERKPTNIETGIYYQMM